MIKNDWQRVKPFLKWMFQVAKPQDWKDWLTLGATCGVSLGLAVLEFTTGKAPLGIMWLLVLYWQWSSYFHSRVADESYKTVDEVLKVANEMVEKHHQFVQVTNNGLNDILVKARSMAGFGMPGRKEPKRHES